MVTYSLGNGVTDPCWLPCFLGGAKVQDKLQLIMNMLDKVDEMIIGGGKGLWVQTVALTSNYTLIFRLQYFNLEEKSFPTGLNFAK